MKNKMGSYELVKEVMIDCYGGGMGEYNEVVMNDFYNSFKEGVEVSKDEFFDFCSKYIDDCGEFYYVRLNWEYIISGGNNYVYDDSFVLDEDENDECCN